MPGLIITQPVLGDMTSSLIRWWFLGRLFRWGRWNEPSIFVFFRWTRRNKTPINFFKLFTRHGHSLPAMLNVSPSHSLLWRFRRFLWRRWRRHKSFLHFIRLFGGCWGNETLSHLFRFLNFLVRHYFILLLGYIKKAEVC